MNPLSRTPRFTLAALALAAASLGVNAQTGSGSGGPGAGGTGTGSTGPSQGPGSGPSSGSGSTTPSALPSSNVAAPSDAATSGSSGSTGTGTGIGYGAGSTSSDTMRPAASSASMGSGTSATRSAYGGGADAYSLLPFTRRGYVGINIGRPELKAGCGSGGYGCDDPNASAHVYTGGMVNDWLGAEIGYINIGKADRSGGSTRSQGVNLSAVAKLPLGAFNIFGKAGATYGQTKVSSGLLSNVPQGKKRGWGASYGAGVGFDFTPNQGVVLQWDRHEFTYPGRDREDVDVTSVGYVYRF